MFLKLLPICWMLFSFGYAEVSNVLRFDQSHWEPFHQHDVMIRGFLYQTEENQWVLASEPNLKSCCIKKGPHIVVSGINLPKSINYAVVIRGTFLIQPYAAANGELQQLFKLENASIVPSQSWPVTSFVIAGAALSIVILFLIKKKL